MRIVAYVREQSPADDAESSFAQGERIRRWAGEHGHLVVAVCHDHPTPEAAADAAPAPGFASVLAIIDAGICDGLVVASLSALGSDLITQEIRMWEIQRRHRHVLSTTDGDAPAIEGHDGDPARQASRALLERLESHRHSLGSPDPMS